MQALEARTHMFGLPKGQRAFSSANSKQFQCGFRRRKGGRQVGPWSRYNLIETPIRFIMIHGKYLWPRWFFGVVTAAMLAPSPAGLLAAEPLKAATNLQSDGAASRRSRLPIVIFFYSRTCPYCREVEENYLRPLLAENVKAPRFLFAAVDVNSSSHLVDFRGQVTTMRDFARKSGIAVVPFLRFVGPDGSVVAPDIVGLTLRDFYSGYIEDSLQRGIATLRAP